MPKTPVKKSTKSKPKVKPAVASAPPVLPAQPAPRPAVPIGVPVLLRAEASRLEVLSSALPDKAQGLVKSQVWAFSMVAAYLDSLGAPERLVKYVPTTQAPARPPSLCKTGRTTRMLNEAIRLVKEDGKIVYIIADNSRDRNHFQHTLADMGAAALPIVVHTPMSVHAFDWEKLCVPVTAANTVILVDHHAIEDKYAVVLAMLHRFDTPTSA